MADNNDDILSLGPETPDSGSSGSANTGGAPSQKGPASRKIAGKPATGGESTHRRLYKRLPFILLFLVIAIIFMLFIVKGMVSAGIHQAIQSPSSQAAKQKRLSYAHEQQNEINSIKRMLREEQEEKPSTAQPHHTHHTHAQQPAGPTLGPGIPGNATNANAAAAQVKAAQIADSPLVSLRGTIPPPQTRSSTHSYAPNSPEAIEKKIQQLQAEKQAAYKSLSDNNLGITKMEKLAMDAAGLHGQASAAQSDSGTDSAWEKQNAGSAGYGSVIPTLPKLHGVALYPGAIIPAVTIGRLNTQIPGQITAQVTRTVYSPTGERAIPAGSRLVGRYDGQVFDGQNRVMMAFTRVIFPDGKEVALHGMNATGPKGTTGVNGNLHTHFWTALGSSLLVALITDGVDSIPNPNNSTTGNTYIGGGSSPTQAGAQVLQQQANNLLQPYTNIQPTVTIPPGTPFRIMVNKTILLPTD
jgi:type IV secretion system protein VirB10